MSRPLTAATILGIASIAATVCTAQDKPALKEVLHRVSAYVEHYGEKASIVVASEHYTQEFTSAVASPEHRLLVAEFAIVKGEAQLPWVGYRDVIEVDGRPVGDRQDRLIRLLTAAGGSDEARRLSEESARFNIGPVQRNFNVPTTALFFFVSDNMDRFRFTQKGQAPNGTWEIAFRETSQPTLIRTPEGRSIATAGSVWVNPADGTIARTRLEMALLASNPAINRISGVIDVSYRRVEALDMWLPATMIETYDAIGYHYTVDRTVTRADYSDYRQFQTSVRIK
jgi:hypothetical protein